MNSKLFVGQMKKGDTGLSQKEQKKVLEEFREGKFNVIVATSIGEEGLDIPKVDLVIFYEPIPSAIRHIQRRGRTGRLEKIRKQKKPYPEVVDKLINSSDIILEVLDARFVQETRNIELEEEIKNQGKRLIYVINKTDLISKDKIKKKALNGSYPHVFVSCKTRKGSKDLRNRIKIESKKLSIKIPAQYTGKVMGLLQKYKERDEWLNDGSYLVVVNIPSAMLEEFYAKLNDVTHGAAVTEELKNE